MKEQTRWLRILLKLGGILLGNFLYALAVTLFIVPNQLITGGTTGLALFVQQVSGLPISIFVSCFNGGMFLIGAFILGKKFALSTVVSTVVYPMLLGALEGSGLTGFVMEEKIVAVLYAGMLIGAGIGIVMRMDASTGGMDIPALVLKKLFGFNVSFVIYLCDCVILLLQMSISQSTAILYGILLILVYTLVLNKCLLLGSAKIQVKIISKEYERINQVLGEKMDCGTSLIHMATGFLHQEQDMILAVISNRDLAKLNRYVMQIDPEAFIVIHQINEVHGRGFTLNKVYQEK
ncbi:MAG: YitT family protein [bacterium]|nr:YitT family protein [bacterium]